MIHSERYSHFVLRIGLAIVFLWFGVVMFMKPVGWFGGSFYGSGNISAMLRITEQQILYLIGVFEVLVALSLLTKVFIQIFAFLAAVLLVLVIVAQGFTPIGICLIGLAASLLSIALHSERPYR